MFLLFLLAFVISPEARAELDPRYQAETSFVSVNPSALGGEFGVAALVEPFLGRQFWIGPKASLLVAGGDSRTRLDLNLGIEGTLWFVNAIGPGLAVDVVAPSTITGENSSVHFRVEPNLAIRLLHYREYGAWALRFGVPYDSAYQWGIQAGVVLEFNGISEYSPKLN